MTDHLAEARRLADHAGGGSHEYILENLRYAIKSLADAVEETNNRIKLQMDDAQARVPQHSPDAEEPQ